jgi:hypothetical protein
MSGRRAVATLVIACLVACTGTPRPRVLLVAIGGRYPSYPAPDPDDEGITMIAPLGCKAGVGPACLAALRAGQVTLAADGRTFRLGRLAHAWNCDTTDQSHEYDPAFESGLQLAADGDALLVTGGEVPIVVAPGSISLDVDLDRDGRQEHVTIDDRTTISIEDGRTGRTVRVDGESGLRIVHLVGAADLRDDGDLEVIVREGRRYRAVGLDGSLLDLGAGCLGI